VFSKGTCPYGFLRRGQDGSAYQLAFPFARHGEDGPASPEEAVAKALGFIRLEVEIHARRGTKTPCVAFPSARPGRRRLLTVCEAKARLRRADALDPQSPGWAQAVLAELDRETREEARHKKDGPLLERLAGLLRKIVKAHGGAWTTLPPLASLARTLNVSVRSVQRALNALRDAPSGEFAFHSEPRGAGARKAANRRGRCVRVALTAWLRYDAKPLLFDEQGRPRGLRPSFRPGAAPLQPGRDPEAPDNVTPGDHVINSATNCKTCLSDSNRPCGPAEKVPHRSPPNQPLQSAAPKETPVSPGLKGSGQKKGSPKQRRFSWAVARWLAREHFGDWDEDDCGWHRWRFRLPLRVIREAVLEALVEGQPLLRVIALFEAAAAETNRAVFDGLARSPGALFRWVFRRNWRAPRRTGPTTGKLAQAPESACAPASPRVATSRLPQDPAQQLAANEGVEIASVPGADEGRQREQLLDPDAGRRIAAMLREWRQTLGATVPA
jgi:hypothetical protein